MRVPDLGRSAHPLVLVGRRHTDVDDGQVGVVLGDDGEQGVAVPDPRDDRVPGVLEQAGQALPQQVLTRAAGQRLLGWCALLLGIALFVPFANFFAMLASLLWIA